MILDSNNSDAYSLLSYLSVMKKDYEKAISSGKRAILLNPSAADAYHALGTSLYFSSRPAEAIVYIKKAIRLNPMPPSQYFSMIASSYRDLDRFEEALKYTKKSLEIASEDLISLVGLAVIYILMEREQDAKKVASKILNIRPDFSVNSMEKASPLKNQKHKKRFYDAARKAGLPD
jgi:tetratricopeptide (TPR) repeat protein